LKQVVYWDLEKNIPLLQRKPRKLTQIVAESDLRPLFSAEFSRLKHYVYKKYGSCSKSLLPRGVALVSQVKDYLDDMKSVYADGGLLCQFYFNPVELKWHVRLSKIGALKAVRDKVISYGYIWKNSISKGVYRLDDFEKKFTGGVSNEFAVLSPEGKILGLGLIEGSKVVIIKKWAKPPSEALEEKSTWRDFVEENYTEIEHKFFESLNILIKFYKKKKNRRKFIVTFSGGKDSSVVLSLAMEAKIDCEVLFNNTGVEHIETLSFVKVLANKLGAPLKTIEAPADFFKKVAEKGPPARDYRWCTDYLKILPSQKYFAKYSHVVNVVGLRRVESSSRSRLGYVFRQSEKPDVIGLAPILKWTGIHVWLYIATRNLPYNPLYLAGFERIGCFMCPSANLSELDFTRKVHSELWELWENVLQEVASRLQLNNNWSKYCLWRWKGLAVKKRELCKAIGDMSLYIEYDYNKVLV